MIKPYLYQSISTATSGILWWIKKDILMALSVRLKKENLNAENAAYAIIKSIKIIPKRKSDSKQSKQPEK
jgi:hypothetical protein